MKRLAVIILVMSVIGLQLPSAMAAQVDHRAPFKREWRSAWLSTVWALDWPASRGSGEIYEKNQKTQMLKYINYYKQLNLTAFFFQVRGMCDAMYNSPYEPWSQYLTGQRGLAPTYDPLEYAVEQGHKNGLEVYAWLNPYRYSTSQDNHGTLDTDYTKTHPEWLKLCERDDSHITILEPGNPEVIDQICKVVADIVTRYDVDGIVFDDYFYQAGYKDEYDDELYATRNPLGLSRGDWRRAQVDTMIAHVNRTIKAIKPYCRFGISPAGVAASQPEVAAKYGVRPSPGYDWQYSGIYADPLSWVRDRDIDFISPQVYWPIGATEDYAQITPWWYEVTHKFGRHCYISCEIEELVGESARDIKATDTDKAEAVQNTQAAIRAQEIVDEMQINRESCLDEAPGMSFFRSSKLSARGFIKKMTDSVFCYKTLPTCPTWLVPDVSQTLVNNIRVDGDTLRWDYADHDMRYVVYALPADWRTSAPDAFTTARYMLSVSYDECYYLSKELRQADTVFAVSVLDRYGYEYAPAVQGEQTKIIDPIKLTFPADGEQILLPNRLRWQAPDVPVSGYEVQVARDSQFSDIIVHQQVTADNMSTYPYADIDGTSTLYWRVRPMAVNAVCDWSQTYSFTGKPFSITSPAANSQEVSVVPTIEWDNAGDDARYTLQVATSLNFLTIDMAFTAQTTRTSCQVPAGALKYGKTYYARVIVESEMMNIASQPVSFTTEVIEMVAPVIIAPEQGADVRAASLIVRWTETPNNGFRCELSENETFPTRNRRLRQTDVNQYECEFDELTDGVYYVRVATKISTGNDITDYSPVVSFRYTSTVGVENVTSHAYHVADGILYGIRPGERYAVYSMSGQQVAAGIATADMVTLPSELTTGIYMLVAGNDKIKIQIP